MNEQPCENFVSENSLGEKGEFYNHQCPKCLSFRGFCLNCSKDHHESGWQSCVEDLFGVAGNFFDERI